jgi:hypothetical protein
MNDLVSVIIPVYKNTNFLKEALNSLIAQTYKNFEVIIVNDGSPDFENIKKIINFFVKKKLNIKLFNFKKNRGVSAALNKAIQQSKGKYISWLSHDDLYHRDKLKKQMNVLKNNSIKICFSNFFLINSKKKVIKKININNSVFEPRHFILFRDKYNFCSALINKIIFKKVGLFDLKKKHTQDYDLLFKILNRYKPYLMNDYLLYSRVHNKQNSVIGKKDAEKEKEKLYLSRFKQIESIYYNSNFIKKIYIIFFLKIKNLKKINIKLLKLIKKENFLITIILKTIFKISEIYLFFKKI